MNRPVLSVYPDSANDATLAYLLCAPHVWFVLARSEDGVGSASPRAANGVSLVPVHAVDDVLSFYLRVADAVAGCSAR